MMGLRIQAVDLAFEQGVGDGAGRNSALGPTGPVGVCSHRKTLLAEDPQYGLDCNPSGAHRDNNREDQLFWDRAHLDENLSNTKVLVNPSQPLDIRLQSLDLYILLTRYTGAGPGFDLSLGMPTPYGLPRDAFLAGDQGHGRPLGWALLQCSRMSRSHLARSWGSSSSLAGHPFGLEQQLLQAWEGSEREEAGEVALVTRSSSPGDAVRRVLVLTCVHDDTSVHPLWP